MQLLIPHAPRAVRLSQVPGARARVAGAAVLCLLALAVAGVALARTQRWISTERAFAERGLALPGAVTSLDVGEDGRPRVGVAYELDGHPQSASGLSLGTQTAAPLVGGKVSLRVLPEAPSRPREQGFAEEAAARVEGGPYAVALLGAILAAVAGLSLIRSVRREVLPLRRGSLVWLTPDRPLPETTGTRVVRASYFRDDLKQAVRARVRPSKLPVRKEEKVLAAVLDGHLDWGVVIDEELLVRLGWRQ